MNLNFFRVLCYWIRKGKIYIYFLFVFVNLNEFCVLDVVVGFDMKNGKTFFRGIFVCVIYLTFKNLCDDGIIVSIQ